MAAVTADDIMRVAKKYLTKDNRTVAILEPVKKES
jgi:predicted Zn-dependent peptidase